MHALVLPLQVSLIKSVTYVHGLVTILLLIVIHILFHFIDVLSAWFAKPQDS